MSTTQNEPLLGLATTEELFREIIARFTTSLYSAGSMQRSLILAEMLGGLSATDREYRTAEPWPEEPDDVSRRGR